MKITPINELTGHEEVFWVCGSKFPKEGDPRHKDAVWGKCEMCGDPIVHAKDALEKATKICQPCAKIMYDGQGEEQEVTMTPEAYAQVEEIYGKEVAEGMMRHYERMLKGKKP